MYIKVRDHWCDIIVMNMHAPTEDKSDDTKDSFHKELQRLLDQFPHMKLLLGGFSKRSRKRRYFQTNSREREFT
jgi:hypothetical protein